MESAVATNGERNLAAASGNDSEGDTTTLAKGGVTARQRTEVTDGQAEAAREIAAVEESAASKDKGGGKAVAEDTCAALEGKGTEDDNGAEEGAGAATKGRGRH